MSISNKVKELRVDMGISQEKLAQMVNVTRQTIISLEKGSYIPSLLLAFELAEVFEMSVEAIFTKKTKDEKNND